MLICFLGLTLTGMPLKFGGESWARALARSLGGVETTGVWHRCFAVLALFACVLHLAWGVGRLVRLRKDKTGWRSILLGPDSPLPTARDLRDILGMARWFLGMGEKPVFERWTYWEKFDYWAVCLATAIVGTSGLMLWYPNVFAAILPGAALNVAKLLHSDLALYVAGCIFMIHLFNTHMRPEKFPLDPSVVTGLVSEEHLRAARPEYLARIQTAGKLAPVLRKVPSRRHVLIVKSIALLVLFAGVSLLALVLTASLGK
jgi:cytochrome b subunit of formate dehydrogenase